MKRKRYFFALAALAAAAAAALTGCSLFDPSEADGSSPSRNAVQNGTADSREDFLASQQEPSTYSRRLYEEAVASGYTGTYAEFLEAVGYIGQGDAANVNRALTSVVSVRCAFTAYPNGPFFSSDVTTAGAGVIYSMQTHGSGFGATADAYIVTNYHVVYYAPSVGTETVPHVSDEIYLYLYGATEPIAAAYVGGVMEQDVAVLRVEGSAVLAASSARAAERAENGVTVGERVYAVGNPAGEGMSVTQGAVSVVSETTNVLAADDNTVISLQVMRTDAAVNHGNSGGGLFNAAGELVGIVSARDETDGVAGFGYAIPLDVAYGVAEEIIARE